MERLLAGTNDYPLGCWLSGFSTPKKLAREGLVFFILFRYQPPVVVQQRSRIDGTFFFDVADDQFPDLPGVAKGFLGIKQHFGLMG